MRRNDPMVFWALGALFRPEIGEAIDRAVTALNVPELQGDEAVPDDDVTNASAALDATVDQLAEDLSALLPPNSDAEFMQTFTALNLAASQYASHTAEGDSSDEASQSILHVIVCATSAMFRGRFSADASKH